MLAVLLAMAAASASAAEWQPYALSAALGDTLDAGECRRYGLFEDLPELERVQVLRRDDDYRLVLWLAVDGESVRQERPISRESIELTRVHVMIVERYSEWEGAGPDAGFSEMQWNWLGLALRYATLRDTQMSLELLDDLDAELEAPSGKRKVQALRDDVARLSSDVEGLHGGVRAYDQSGRFDLIRYSGLWGIWAAIALPASMESDDPKLYAASLMAVPTASILAAVNWSRQSNVGKGRSAFIALGGNLGIWHGLGWSALADRDGSEMVGIALGASAGGIVLGAGLSEAWNVGEGHGQLTSSALYWGMWYGLVLANIADDTDSLEGDDVLRSMLLTSVGTVGAIGVLARNSTLKQNQVRLINLGGLVGTLFGFGIDVIGEVGDARGAFLIAGLGTTVGLLVSWQAVRNSGSSFDSRLGGGSLGLSAVPDRLGSNRPMPALAFRGEF